MTFGAEKPARFSYPMVKNYEDKITRFGGIQKRDRRTDGQTSHDGIDLDYATLA